MSDDFSDKDQYELAIAVSDANASRRISRRT
jgi:hypothetical protein